MASERNKLQAEALAVKCRQFRAMVHGHMDACKRHGTQDTKDQCEDNEIILHMMMLINELEKRENGLKSYCQ